MLDYTIKTDADQWNGQAEDWDDAARQYDPSVSGARALLEKIRDVGNGAWCWIECDESGERIGGADETELADALDAATKTIAVTYDAGEGVLAARCDEDHTLSSNVIRWSEPITAKTDSWAVAQAVTGINGAVPVAVDHDVETVLVIVSTI